MGCGVPTYDFHECKLSSYYVFHKKLFQPQTAAGMFWKICQTPGRADYSAWLETIRLSVAQTPKPPHFGPEDDETTTDDFNELKDETLRNVIKTNPIQRNRVSFNEMLAEMKQELPYLTETDLFQVYWFLSSTYQQSKEPLQSALADREQRDVENIDVKTFIQLAYLMYPEQFKNVLKGPFFICFYNADLHFNTMAQRAFLYQQIAARFGPSERVLAMFNQAFDFVSQTDFELIMYEQLAKEYHTEALGMQFSVSEADLAKYVKQRKKQLENTANKDMEEQQQKVFDAWKPFSKNDTQDELFFGDPKQIDELLQ